MGRGKAPSPIHVTLVCVGQSLPLPTPLVLPNSQTSQTTRPPQPPWSPSIYLSSPLPPPTPSSPQVGLAALEPLCSSTGGAMYLYASAEDSALPQVWGAGGGGCVIHIYQNCPHLAVHTCQNPALPPPTQTPPPHTHSPTFYSRAGCVPLSVLSTRFGRHTARAYLDPVHTPHPHTLIRRTCTAGCPASVRRQACCACVPRPASVPCGTTAACSQTGSTTTCTMSSHATRQTHSW